MFEENKVRWKVRLLSILSVHIIKCTKVCALFAENKVCFACAEQLWCSCLYLCEWLKGGEVGSAERGIAGVGAAGGSYPTCLCRHQSEACSLSTCPQQHQPWQTTGIIHLFTYLLIYLLLLLLYQTTGMIHSVLSDPPWKCKYVTVGPATRIKAKIHYTGFPVASSQQVRNINDKYATSWQLPRLHWAVCGRVNHLGV